MCEYDIIVYGCGHQRFFRLRFPCPAGLCPSHNECYAGNSQVADTYPVETPPFCKICFEKEVISIDDAYFRAESSFAANIRQIRRFYCATYGRALNADKLRIRQLLVKKREADQELLEVEFYGPTRRIPNDNSAFLYRRPGQRTHHSHSECTRAFRAAENWDSSQDGEDQEDLTDDFADDLELGSLFDYVDDSEEDEYCRLQRLDEVRLDRRMEEAFEEDSDEGEMPEVTEPPSSVEGDQGSLEI
ncbi:MAG: hypothetical protein LQ343_006012 [Gyalolechia ehrenbergii]|nr:MAG: hypothetical protein LQ343_006012 [Gyalolechia ehrenbergii]